MANPTLHSHDGWQQTSTGIAQDERSLPLSSRASPLNGAHHSLLSYTEEYHVELQRDTEQYPFVTESSASLTDSNKMNSSRASLSKGKPMRETPCQTILNMEWWWWWEIGAALLSISCIAAIVGILLHIDNMMVGQWHFMIAPNSLIAIMTTVSKTAMMVPTTSCISQVKWDYFRRASRPYKDLEVFDTASRGPWGSLQFLGRMRTQALTASALAIITLVALGFEPTAQQILRVSTRELEIYPQPSISVASDYSSRLAEPAYESSREEGTTHVLSTIIGGLFGNALRLDINCPSQSLNCTWPPFNTLGICAVARNVTSEVVPVCFTDNSSTPLNSSTTCQYDFATIRNASLVGPTTLPRKLFGLVEQPQPLILNWQLMRRFGPDGSKYLASEGSVGQEHAGLNMDLVRYPMDQIRPTSGTLKQAQAWNVQWYWCSHSYTNVLATPSGLQSFDVLSERLYRDADDPIVAKRRQRTDTYRVNGSDVEYRIDGYRGSEKSLFNHLARTLRNDLRDRSVNENDLLSFGQYLYEADIPQFAQNLADTLSILVRQNNSGDNLWASAYGGTAMGTVAYYHVRAGWLALPFIEVLLSTVLLVVVILKGRRQALLKSSQLALVLYGREGRGQELAIVDTYSNVTLENTIGRLQVRLDRNVSGKVGFIHDRLDYTESES